MADFLERSVWQNPDKEIEEPIRMLPLISKLLCLIIRDINFQFTLRFNGEQ